MKHLFNATLLLLLITGVMSCTSSPDETVSSTDSPGIEKEHEGVHALQHQQHAHLNYDSEEQWDSLNNITTHATPMPEHQRSMEYKTFGWHIYSKGSAYKSYNFSLLWGISYFSYHVNPKTGNYQSIHEWKTTAMVDSAQAHNCQVFLSVSNFGKKDNALFLENSAAQQTLIDSLIVLLKLRNANGVNIDFEGVAAENKVAFNQFITLLAQKLHAENSDYQVSLALYAVDYHQIFDIPKLNPYIDFYTLMGYDYYGGFSSHTGPISPLKNSHTWGENSIESSVEYYTDQGIPSTKLIVGLPYYGGVWETKNLDLPSKAVKFIAHDAYSKIEDQILSSELTVKYDKESASSYCVFKNKDGINQQIWFDDSLSLAHKYRWIKTKKLSGVGIWALGYDHGYSTLWELLATQFGEKK